MFYNLYDYADYSPKNLKIHRKRTHKNEEMHHIIHQMSSPLSPS